MSFRTVTEATPRLHRSELAVPASRPAIFEKAAASAADLVFLDLEDAVAPDEKEAARRNAIDAMTNVDWGDKIMAVRINGLDTHYMYRDVIDLIEQAGERLDLFIIPKVGDARDVYALDMLTTQVEAAMGRKKRIGFSLIIETALGLANVERIAEASPRIEALQMGVADLAASLRMRTTNIGGPVEEYASAAGVLDAWQFPMSRVITAARAAGRRPIAGPFGNFKDPEGLEAAARRARALGAEGMMAIHPSQIAIINSVFTPSEAEIHQARRILQAMEEATRTGRGAVALDGRLLDIASIRQAEALLEKAKMLG
ncbi:HpcH/HpaI aldolase/citrate lyase family protein [Rhodovarius lipocyclicus]|uniref:HpcH/HpaI aldolase/citrate lyase family protein n=1 Tax=Rhodovarius lipocyclicus TaxID=268410 RepID=UPI00135B5D76|nr:CoA ester lyase [Rhodovarius lipocyclicus]